MRIRSSGRSRFLTALGPAAEIDVPGHSGWRVAVASRAVNADMIVAESLKPWAETIPQSLRSLVGCVALRRIDIGLCDLFLLVIIDSVGRSSARWTASHHRRILDAGACTLSSRIPETSGTGYTVGACHRHATRPASRPDGLQH